jgi:N-hydroxyarylamine O-acetyltransferase
MLLAWSSFRDRPRFSPGNPEFSVFRSSGNDTCTKKIPAESIDLEAYLERIGAPTPIAPDPQTLRAIIAAHVAAIPFENLDPFLGISPALDIASVQRTLVRDHRGGYRFEQNRLLSDALRAIGFNVTDLAARVLWGQPEDAVTARTHMLLRVKIEGRSWLADAGFGGNTPTAPLELVPAIEQATPHEPFRLIRRDDSDWRSQLFAAGAWQTLYRFDLQPHSGRLPRQQLLDIHQPRLAHRHRPDRRPRTGQGWTNDSIGYRNDSGRAHLP